MRDAVGDTTSIKRVRSDSDPFLASEWKPRKRTRGNPSHAEHDDYPTLLPTVERRRVNPESLAKRLGPDLVREMEAYISPGNTNMPSFAVRRELYERYGIDRRHVYDYFHSRGLRVVKEERHQNLTKPRERVACSSSIPQTKQFPNCNSVPSDVDSEKKANHVPRFTLRPPFHPPSKKIKQKFKPKQPSHVTPTTETCTFISSTHCGNHQGHNPSFDSHMNESDLSSPSPHRDFSFTVNPVFEPIAELLDLQSTSSAQTSSSISSPDSDFDQPLYHNPLSPKGREALYSCLDNFDSGESVGTYRAFMMEQVKLYSERLAPSPLSECGNYDVASQYDEVPTDGVDFRKWMLFGSVKIKTNNARRRPTFPFYKRYQSESNLSTPSKCSKLSALGSSLSPARKPEHSSCLYFSPSLRDKCSPRLLDDLFPEPAVAIDDLRTVDLLGSPVLRSENFCIGADMGRTAATKELAKTLSFRTVDSPSASQAHSGCIQKDSSVSPSPRRHKPRRGQGPEIKDDLFHSRSTSTAMNFALEYDANPSSFFVETLLQRPTTVPVHHALGRRLFMRS